MRPEICNRIEELLRPLSKVSKTWHDHISQNLDEYLSYIEEVVEDDMTINFVQAGMMIENTARVYAVNVDLLWQFMSEIREVILLDKKNLRSRENEEAGSSRTAEDVIRTRRKKVYNDNFSEFIPKVIDPDMKPGDQQQSVKLLPMRLQMFERSDWKRRKRPYHVYDMEKDTLDLADYSAMYQTSRTGKLQLNMLKELIEDNYDGEQSMQEMVRVLEVIVSEFSHLSCDDSDDNSNPPSIAGLSDVSTVDIGSAGSHSLELVTVTPPPSPLTVKRSASANIEGPHVKRSMSDADSEKEFGFIVGRKKNTNETRDQILDVNGQDPWNGVPVEGGMKEKALNKQMTYTIPTVLRPLSRSERRRRSSGDGRNARVVIDYIDGNMFSVHVKRRRFPTSPEMLVYYTQEVKKKKTVIKKHSTITMSLKVNLEALHNQLSQDITTDFAGYEDLEADVGEEDGFCGFPDAVESVVVVDAMAAVRTEEDWNNDEAGIPPSAEADKPQDEAIADTAAGATNSQETTDNDVVSPLEIPSLDEQPGCSHDNASDISSTRSDDVMRQMVERVAEWEHFIRPRLKMSHARGHFDIHKVGSEILGAFPDSTSTPAMDFLEFLADKPREDVARYFLGSLQLAATYNVDLTKSVPGDLSMDCMQMTLLSSNRHHETLEEYEPPSKGARRRKRILTAPSTSRCSDSESDSDSSSESDHNSRSKRKRRKR